MKRTAFDPRPSDLPDEIPIFPLPGVLLLPGANLPLNVFEPRYLDMVSDALGSGRLIAMIQPDPARATDEDVVVYRVGCAGRITAFNETDDGRFLINLRGVCRFEVVEELEPRRGYRRVRADWRRFCGDVGEPAAFALDRERFHATMSGYFDANGLRVDREALEKLSDECLVDFLAMNLPFEPQEKQVLLECAGCEERAEALLTLAEMNTRCPVADDSAAGSETRH